MALKLASVDLRTKEVDCPALADTIIIRPAGRDRLRELLLEPQDGEGNFDDTARRLIVDCWTDETDARISADQVRELEQVRSDIFRDVLTSIVVHSLAYRSIPYGAMKAVLKPEVLKDDPEAIDRVTLLHGVAISPDQPFTNADADWIYTNRRALGNAMVREALRFNGYQRLLEPPGSGGDEGNG